LALLAAAAFLLPSVSSDRFETNGAFFADTKNIII